MIVIMNKEQTRNLAIVIISIVLIGGGIFYYQKQNKSTDLAVKPPSNESESDQITNQTTSSSLGQKSAVNTSSKGSTTINKVENIAKFNLAMDGARKSFLARDYDRSIVYYNEALLYNDKADTAYSGLFIVYSAQNNIDKARIALENAIKLNPRFTEYWIEKLVILDEKTTLSYADLKRIYQEGLAKVDPATKINLVTSFARISENNGEKDEAMALWGYAIEIYSQNKLIYQAEIDRLQNY